MNIENISSEEAAKEFWINLRKEDENLFQILIRNLPGLNVEIHTHDDGWMDEWLNVFASFKEAESSFLNYTKEEVNNSNIELKLPIVHNAFFDKEKFAMNKKMNFKIK